MTTEATDPKDHADMMAYAMLADLARRREQSFSITSNFGEEYVQVRLLGSGWAAGQTLAAAVLKLTEKYPELFKDEPK